MKIKTKQMVLFLGSLFLFGNVFEFSNAEQNPIAKNDSEIPIYVMVHPVENTTLSSEANATVKLIPVREGDNFKAGDILIEFDCRVQHADYKKALAQQTLTENAYKSAEKLKSYSSISDFELIKAKSEAEIASSDVEKLSVIIDKCIIKAPYSGSVSEAMVHAGETVKPGDPLLKIVNTKDLELEMQVPSIWLRWLQIGTKFNVKINEISKTILAKVSKINPQINSVSQTVKIIGVLIEPEPKLLPGMSGQATFPRDVKSDAA